MVAARLSWSPEVYEIFDHPWGNEVNLFLFDALTQDMTAHPDALLAAWLKERYNTAAVAPLLKLYKMTYHAHHLTYSFLGHNCADHSGVFRRRSADTTVACRIRSILGDRLWSSAGRSYHLPGIGRWCSGWRTSCPVRW